MAKDKINVGILDDERIHNQIKDTILDYIMFEAKYMGQDEIEETTAQVKDLLRLKMNNKKDSIRRELHDILKSKMMYDVEINEYAIAGQTVIKIMDKIMDKWAKKLEKELYVIVGIKKRKKNIFKRLFSMCMTKESESEREAPSICLTKKEVDTLRRVRRMASFRRDNATMLRRINGSKLQKGLLPKF